MMLGRIFSRYQSKFNLTGRLLPIIQDVRKYVLGQTKQITMLIKLHEDHECLQNAVITKLKQRRGMQKLKLGYILDCWVYLLCFKDIYATSLHCNYIWVSSSDQRNNTGLIHRWCVPGFTATVISLKTTETNWPSVEVDVVLSANIGGNSVTGSAKRPADGGSGADWRLVNQHMAAHDTTTARGGQQFESNQSVPLDMTTIVNAGSITAELGSVHEQRKNPDVTYLGKPCRGSRALTTHQFKPNPIQSNPMSSDGRRNSSMPASQIQTQIKIGRSPVPVRLALKS